MKSNKGPVINLKSLPFDTLILLPLIIYCTCWSGGNIWDYSHLHLTEKPGRLQSLGSQSRTWLVRARAHTHTHTHTHTHLVPALESHSKSWWGERQKQGRCCWRAAGRQPSRLCLWLGGWEGQLEAENLWRSKWRWFAAIRQWHSQRI